MKTKITALALIAATAFSLAPKPAYAGDKGLAIAGGILGGIIIGSAIADSRRSAEYPPRSTTVIVNGRDDRCDDGYWKDVSVRVWVPGGWVVERHHGRTIKRYVEGYYTFRTDRVWVAYDRHDRNDRHGRYEPRGREVVVYGRGR